MGFVFVRALKHACVLSLNGDTESVMRLLLRFVSRLLIVPGILLLQGCSGHPYASDFKSWLGVQILNSYPVAINKISIEQIAQSGSDSVFSFSGTGASTEELYTFSNLVPPEQVNRMAQKFEQEYVSDEAATQAGLDKLMPQIERFINAPVLAERATKKGTKVMINGQARATLGDSGWIFSITRLSVDGLSGSIRPDNSVVKGTREEKAVTKEMNELLSQFEQTSIKAVSIQNELERVAAAEAEAERQKQEAQQRRQEQIEREEQMRVAEAAAKQKSTVLQLLGNGAEFAITWQAQNSRGRMAAQIASSVQIGDSHSLEGTLNENLDFTGTAKPFSAVVSGTGTEEDPVILNIKVAPSENDLRYYQHRTSSLGFLAGNANFNYQLSFNSARNVLEGELESSFLYNYGPEGPVMFLWEPITR